MKKLLLIAVVTMTLIDGALTTHLINKYGSIAELNPLLRGLVDIFGIASIMSAKAVTMALLWYVVDSIRESILVFVATIYFALMLYWAYLVTVEGVLS